MKSSTRDKSEGKWHTVKGKIKQVTGKAVGNRDLEDEGKAENIDASGKDRPGQGHPWEVKMDAGQSNLMALKPWNLQGHRSIMYR